MNSYTIRTASLFDGHELSGPSAVTVTDGVITGVEPASTELTETSADNVVDLGPDSCLLPGLIDSHVHLAFDAGPDPVSSLQRIDDTELLAGMRTAADSMLRAGITTVRDLGDRGYLTVALGEEFRGQPHLGPEILSAGPPLTTPLGHCHFFGGEVEGAEGLRQAVRERHARGCAVVKIMASGGNMTSESVAPHVSQYGLDDLRVVVDEAHRLGLPVAAHAHGVTAIMEAVEAGVDTLEHVSFLTEAGSRPDPEALAAVAESGSFVSLTLGRDPGRPLPDHPAMISQARIILGAFRDLYKMGAKVVLGSDAGIGPFKPHDVLPYAVSDAVDLGFSPLDALASVTSVAARACGVEGRKGRIAVGADADLLAVGGNPVTAPAALRDVRAVFRAGVRVR
ncbi:amidohydrolase family protein [Streptomyces sp. NPDC001185]|uniref:amidohydrolase family protein n=1 Tax=Streptomyces sp. NPDC001185 TaxID=3154380 RepID=UPI0033227708